MARMSKKDHLKRKRSQIEAAAGFRKAENLEELWRRLLDLYRGKHFDASDLTYEDKIAVNVAFATINVIGPSVAINHPKITVNARLPEHDDHAVITEAVVNYWWRHHNFTTEFQRAVKDSLIFGLGWLKTGYRFIEEEVDDPDGYKERYDAAIIEADDYAMENPDLAGDLPTDDEIAASVVSTKMVVKQDHPFVERCSIFDVFVDPEATSITDAKWIAQKVVKTQGEVQANESYNRHARLNVQADSRQNENWLATKDSKRNDDIKRVTIWEFYDLLKGTMCVFPATGEEYLVDETPQPYKFGHPFVPIVNYSVPDEFYPIGDLEMLEPLQLELNMTRSAMFNDRKTFRRAWLYNPQSFDKEGMGQLTSDADHRLIPVNGNTPLDQAVIPMPGQQINPQLYQDSDIIERDISEVSGVNEYMRGSVAEVRRTATEAAIINDASNARAADKLARVEHVIAECGRRLVILAQQYLSGEQVARVTGQNGRPIWVQFDRSDLSAEFDFEVEGGSTQPYNEVSRRQTAKDLLQALAPYGDPQLGMVNMPEVIRYALQYGFGIKDPSKFMGQGAPDPAVAGLGGPPPTEGGEQIPPEIAAMMQAQGGDPAQMAPSPQEEMLGLNTAPQLEGQVGLSLPA